MKNPIYISDYSFVAPVDDFLLEIDSCFSKNVNGDWIASISSKSQQELANFLKASSGYNHLDRSVQMALLAGTKLSALSRETGVNIGSSRGATGLWEQYHKQFLEGQEGSKTSLGVHASPLTTLGNISTWVAQDLRLQGTAFSHSITCATAAHSILNALAWMGSGMANDFLVGGSEAPLTDFTIAQMKALRIYAHDESEHPCQALHLEKSQNTMILGEAAALFHLSKRIDGAKAKITGHGTAIEQLSSATSVSEKGDCLQQSMKMTMGELALEDIDAIITHAPGTIKGDAAEMNAIQSIFGNQVPYLCNTKWQMGHSLGASAAMNLVLALQMFEQGQYPAIPYLKQEKPDQEPKRILINATGFGGNAVSLLLEKVVEPEPTSS